MMNKHKKTILGVAILVVVATTALSPFILPRVQGAISHRLVQMLEAKGFRNVKLTLSGVGLGQAKLRDISIGQDTPLILKTLDMNYSLTDLWNGNLREVTLSGLALNAMKTNNEWAVVGLENLKSAAGVSSGPFKLPVTQQDLSILPFEIMKVTDSALNVTSDQWQVSLPLTITLDKTQNPKIDYGADHITGKIKNIAATTGKASIQAIIDPTTQSWQGTWTIDDIAVDSDVIKIPSLSGEGKIIAKADLVTITGTIKSKDNLYLLSFVLEEHLDKASASSLTILSAQMPFKGGRVSLKNEKIMLAQTQPLRLDLRIDKVEVNDLMQSLTGKRVSATGLFSGTIPVVIAADGSLSFPDGALNTEGPGTISMPPDAIPGAGEKLDLVRNILKNFQYAKFSLGVNSVQDKGLSVLLSLEGKNSDVENGRLVKLNVNLTGDLLDFIRQNAMLFNDPKALLKQSNDEKN